MDIEDKIKSGDKITISGCGKSKFGHDVLFGKSVKTGRPMKVYKETVFIAKGVNA